MTSDWRRSEQGTTFKSGDSLARVRQSQRDFNVEAAKGAAAPKKESGVESVEGVESTTGAAVEALKGERRNPVNPVNPV